MPYIADLYHDTEYDMCRESDRMQRPKITGTVPSVPVIFGLCIRSDSRHISYSVSW